MPHPQQYTLCIDNLTLPANIGIDAHEYKAPQMVTMDIHLSIDLTACNWQSFAGVPCYATISKQIADLVLSEHTDLCEQLAEKIARCIFDNPLVKRIAISIRKPHALSQAKVGVDMVFVTDLVTDKANSA